MIGFMSHAARLEVHYIKPDLRAVDVLATNYYPLGAFDFEVDAGKAEAAFLAGLFPFAEFNDRIDEHDLVLGFFLRAAIHDKEPLQHSNLRCRQTNSWS